MIPSTAIQSKYQIQLTPQLFRLSILPPSPICPGVPGALHFCLQVDRLTEPDQLEHQILQATATR